MYGERYAVGQVVTYMLNGVEQIGEIEFIYSSGRVRIIDAEDTSVLSITGIVSHAQEQVDVPKTFKDTYDQPVKKEVKFRKTPEGWSEVAHQKHIDSVVDSVTNEEVEELFDSLTKFNNENWRSYWVDQALLNNDEEMFKKFA